MRHSLYKVFGIALIIAWMSVVVAGASKLWTYDSTAGTPAHLIQIQTWPASANFTRDCSMPALVILIHPQCPCSRATVGELARLMARCNGKLRATVLVIHPANVPDKWDQTELTSAAAAIPGVTVISDKDGKESQIFGASTSGQSLLYGVDGHLLFSGGITESRGHYGDNAGESAIMSIVLIGSSNLTAGPAQTPVYGCPLFDKPDALQTGWGKACQK